MNKIKFNTSQEGIDHLRNEVSKEEGFFELLNASLSAAKKAASNGALNSQLFTILDWPTDLVSYINYLEEFKCWKPQQSSNPAWQDADGNSQEVYDRLCHFYFLIDQKVGANGTTIVQNIDGFKEWLVAFTDVWGSFLNTTDSFSEDILQTFIKYSPKYRIQDSMINGKPNDPNGWNTFNEFFARELNPGLRPIASPQDNSVITAPADCTYRMQYHIDENSVIEEICIKKTHCFNSIPKLLEKSKYANVFANGTFVHYFLGPYSYHRFHTPVAGMLEECYPVAGLTFLEVNLKKDQFDAPDNAENGYQFTQARGILTIDTTKSPYGNVGIVAVIPVGMCQVSSVHMTAIPGKTVNKGDEFGYFMFGGSDIILLFQDGFKPNIDDCKNYRYYGTDIGICPPNDPK